MSTPPKDDTARHNRAAWDALVAAGNQWTVPVDAATIAAARGGEWELVLTPTKPVPREWYPALKDEPVLLLAGAGGQQAPVLAAAGARVTVIDNSPRQLEQDQLVARREGLSITSVQGDMRDLSAFADDSFALIFHLQAARDAEWKAKLAAAEPGLPLGARFRLAAAGSRLSDRIAKLKPALIKANSASAVVGALASGFSLGARIAFWGDCDCVVSTAKAEGK